jgi:FlaA1/EpsC-like NDP-sugar epimerase
VRDIQSIKNAMHGVDYIFHAVALENAKAGDIMVQKSPA